MSAEALPDFFAAVPAIVVADRSPPCSARPGRRLEYSLRRRRAPAGHSCPTVAGAADGAGPGASLPERAAAARDLGGAAAALAEGVTGVVGSVLGRSPAQPATAASGPAGRHVRRDLLRYGVPMAGDVRITRLDNGAAVELTHHAQAVPRPPTDQS